MSGIPWVGDTVDHPNVEDVKMAERLSADEVRQATSRIEDVLISSLNWREVVEVLSREILFAGIFRSLTISLVDWDQGQVEIVANYLSVDDRGHILPDRRVVASPSYIELVSGAMQETGPLVGRRISLDDSDDFTVMAALSGQVLVRGFIEYNYHGKKDQRNVKMGYFIPLRCGGRVAAVLATGSPVEEESQIQRRIDWMGPLFKQVALALEHARMHRSLEERNAEMEERERLLRALTDVERTLLSSLDRDQILDRLVQQVATAGVLSSLMVALVDHRRQLVEVMRSCTYEVVDGESVTLLRESKMGLCYDLSEDNITSEVARTGQMQVIDGWDDRFDTRVDSFGNRQGRTAYFIPIKKDDRTIAILATGSKADQKSDMLRRLEQLQPLFDMVALALNHANLYSELSEERRRLSSTLEGLSDGVVATDEIGRIIQCNRPALEFMRGKDGAPRSMQLPGALDCLNGSKGLGELLVHVLENGISESVELELQIHDIHLRTVRMQGVPVWGDANDLSGGVFVLRDVTNERVLEQTRLQSDRIDALGYMAGGIAHDFNNLLASTLVNASLLRQDSLDMPTQQSIVGDIEESLQRARDLTGQLMTFVRGEELTRELVALADVVLKAVTFALRGSQVVHSVELGPDLWSVEIDAMQIGQVVHNLAINALQAMPDGGAVKITLQNVMVEANSPMPLPSGDYVECGIRDWGEGIGEEDLRAIFDPYFTTKADGAGLGLFTSYAIIDRHGGWLTAESTQGQGAEFRFFLPRAKERPETVLESIADATEEDGRGRILLLDDDRFLCAAVSRALRRQGYDPVAVERGDDALSIYREQLRGEAAFDVVVLDLTVRGGPGGVEVARRLLEINPDQLIILSSGHGDREEMTNYRDYGFAATLVKPYTLDEIKSLINRFL